MKNFFPGYFIPTEAEFKKLWSTCVFAFDTNVLLGLYRSTPETLQVFWDILEKVADRVFLPSHAAFEYLRGRLGVISVRAESFGKIATEAEKLAKSIEATAQEHALRNGTELVAIAKKAAAEIRELAERTANQEPDLIRVDPILEKLAKLFERHTGEPYPSTRLAEIYSEAAQRYQKGIPPGFKDEKKPEPDRYGDVVIWFQLMEHAKSCGRPQIFVTGDGKEDWWHKHRGDTLGPRPELRQEMMDRAGVSFYMYTVPRFLEFAKQFLKLELDTRKAESEFEKIEKQDREAAERAARVPETYYISNPVFYESPSMGPSYTSYGNYADAQPSSYPWWRNIQAPGWYTTWSKPENYETKNKLFSLLPINGYIYQAPTGAWKCEIVSEPASDKQDPACYHLKFDRQGVAAKPRQLTLKVSLHALERDADWRYKTAIGRAITDWLSGQQDSGELVCLP